MNDVLSQLAAANPVHADELTSLELPALDPRRPSRRLVLATAAIAIALAASLVGLFVLRGSNPVSPTTTRQGPTGATGPEMLRHPLGGLASKKVTLADAAAAIGEPVVMPDTSLVGPRSIRAVWASVDPIQAVYHRTEGNAAVTFPTHSVIVTYRIGGGSSAARYAADAEQITGATVIDLHGTPALAIPQNPGEKQFGVIVFGIDGLEIQVIGPYDEATLEAIAQSIVDRYQAQPPAQSVGIGSIDWAHPPAGERVDSMRDAAALVGFAPVLPRHHGTPAIFVDGGSRELTLVYDHAAGATYGRFEKYWVTERPAGATTTRDLYAIARTCAAKGGCDASERMIALRGGHRGLLMVGATTTGLSWVDRGVYFDVLTPSSIAGGQAALDVATGVILAEDR